MVSVNIEAKKTVDLMIKNADELNIAVDVLSNGSTVIDAGVNVSGSLKQVNFILKYVWVEWQMLAFLPKLSENSTLPSVKKNRFPAISTLGSQKPAVRMCGDLHWIWTCPSPGT